MPNHIINPDDWYYFLQEQLNRPVAESFELLPILRFRFGNLLREAIISVRLEYASGSYLIAITCVGNELIRLPIDAFVPERLLAFDLFDPPRLDRLLTIITAWIESLDTLAAAREFELFTPHALALMERVTTDLKESAYESEEKSMQFYLSLSQVMGREFSPAIRKKNRGDSSRAIQGQPG